MGTMVAMWSGQAIPVIPSPGSLSMCVLQNTNLQVRCMKTFQNESPDNTPPPNQTQFYAISGGGNFTCGLEYGSHFLVCWGQSIPEGIQKNVSYASVASGATHICALRVDTSFADCWGLTIPPPNLAFTTLASGWGFSCGLTRDGVAIFWGNLLSDIPQPVNEKYRSIFAGGNTVCGVTFSGRLCCWGTKDHGQSYPPDGVNFLSVAGGLYHTCGIRADNRQVVCWGDNGSLQLMSPAGVAFSQIAAGDFYTCGMRMDPPYEIVCWGNSVSYHREELEASFTVSRGLCVSECRRNQFQINQACPFVGDKVCMDCSICGAAGSSSVSGCGPFSDTTCDRASHRPPLHIVGVSLVVVAMMMLVLIISAWFYARRRKVGETNSVETKKLESSRAAQPRDLSTATRVVAMSPLELEAATRNYSDDMVLGRGSFGTVYRGVLGDGREVAIKRASLSNSRSGELFDQELQLLSRTHHSCLVNLVGYCSDEKLLVFEYMSRGSLHDNIFRESGPDAGLGWACRIKLAAQAARGLEYLHRYASPAIIHRDVKSANILLDDDWNAHVADFGLSLFGPLGSATHLSNMTIVGTPGYLDPEYGLSMKLTTKSDVYSFGVVLLEVLSGKKPVDPFRPARHIVAWAQEIVARGSDARHELLDSDLEPATAPGPLYRAVELALECTRVSGRERPSMTEVAKGLEEISEELQASDNDQG